MKIMFSDVLFYLIKSWKGNDTPLTVMKCIKISKCSHLRSNKIFSLKIQPIVSALILLFWFVGWTKKTNLNHITSPT